MSEYTHLVNIIFQSIGTKETTREVTKTQDAINKSLGSMEGIGKVAPNLTNKLTGVSDAMKGMGFNETQINSFLANMKEGGTLTKLTGSQVDLMRNSLVKAGATQPQIQKLMQSLDAKGVIPVAPMNDFQRALARVAVVVPVWMAARAAMQAIQIPIQEVIKAFSELDQGLAKVMTVSRISASEQKKFYGELATAAVKYYLTSTASMKQITEAMYQIGTAGRSTTEILNGFQHVLNLSIATFGDVVNAGRVLTGVLNVYGDSMEGFITSSEKMKYISDLLTHTWKNNQVELSEISSAIGYVGAAADSLDVDLKTLVGTIGFLNTGLLRGSKAGTSLLNAFIQIAAKIDKLRDLGVVFDPRKPLNFVDIMRQLKTKFDESGKSLELTGDLFDVFGKRGGRAISLIIQDWESWQKRINITNEELDKTAEKTKEIAEKTLMAAFAKFWKTSFTPPELKGTNPLVEYFNDVANANIKAFKLLETYTDLLERGIKIGKAPFIPDFGAPIFAKATKEALTNIQEFFDLVGESEIRSELTKPTEETSQNMLSSSQFVKKLFDDLGTLGVEWNKINEQTKHTIINLLGINEEDTKAIDYLRQIYEYRKKNLIAIKQEEIAQGGLSSTLKKRIEDLNLETKYSLMKIEGIKEEDIARTKIVDKVNEINKLTEKENKARIDNNQELYKTLNLSDVLAGNWDKILKSGSLILDKDKDILEFEKLRLQIQTEIVNRREKEINTVTSILKLSGQQESSIIKQEMALKYILYGEDYLKNSMDDRLKLAQALTKEANDQVESSSRLVELYDTARKYGIKAAQEISEYLGGIRKFSELSASAIMALRRTMPAEYKEEIATKYFKEREFKFPEAIEKERITTRTLSVLNQIMVEPIQIKIDLDSQGITEEILKKISPLLEDELRKKGSSLYNVFHNEIELH